jgi:hypothetical protein
VVLAGLPGAGIAEATSTRQGLLVAIALFLSGLCLVLAVHLRRSRLTAVLIAAFAGATLGMAIAFLVGGVAGALLGPAVGWPTFWISWTGTTMLLIARGALR